ncbi:MAG TPA: heparan-alpha-glucosaminide N-acetyltransferase domain-containing protein [Mucilaginibacter sp.]|jgi:uncharacterized membrane protein|nr:heparan-alpha-glucosaminide N-acetyltransferase domain-containing protein [Mucilaginibacter sp.]
MPNLYEPSGKQRINSIDILRGVIMLIMALDHTRDFFHNAGATSDPTDMATTTPILFFTRWITHFCAPNFVFLSGISAYIAGTRRTKSELSAFLIKRGFWLVFVEVVILTFAFTLNPFYNVVILQVLWVIGLSMVILGLLVKLPLKFIGIIGALIFLSHDILDYLHLPKAGTEANLMKLFFMARGSVIPIGQTHFIFDLYAIIPWTGVMLLGYVFGSMYQSSFDPQRRRKILMNAGLISLAVFLVLRYFNLYGDPNPWSVQRNGVYTFLSFLNVSKYPPSLMYSLMTIGVGMLVLALTEKVQNKLTAIFIIYGNVPFFYYVLHFYMLRITDVVVFYVQGFGNKDIVDPKHQNPFLFSPPHFGFNLGGVYIVWLCVIIALYFPCRWFSRYKKTHNQWWLSYL